MNPGLCSHATRPPPPIKYHHSCTKNHCSALRCTAKQQLCCWTENWPAIENFLGRAERVHRSWDLLNLKGQSGGSLLWPSVHIPEIRRVHAPSGPLLRRGRPLIYSRIEGSQRSGLSCCLSLFSSLSAALSAQMFPTLPSYCSFCHCSSSLGFSFWNAHM